MTIDLHGIIPALVTPYGADGRIAEGVTRKLVDALLDQGINGVYLGGTTGEGPLQSPTERTSFTALVAETVAGRVPVIAHVGAPDTATCIALARDAASAGAVAVSAVGPFYYQHGPEQVRRHFLDIADASPVPFLPYHLPMAGGDDTTFRLFVDLAAHQNVAGFKYTSRDVYELQQLRALCGDDVAIFNGADEVCVHGLLAGASGAIGSTYNFMARQFVRIMEVLEAGDAQAAARLQAEANAVIHAGTRFDNVAFARAVLRAQGFEVGAPRRPIEQLRPDDDDVVARIVAETPFL
ncbi:dihydrodipicolinate synthase family protein [Phytoactinopolyspora halotolerans]|uniref:N-acetylneuraminate lyase n=1 Tax=Phytoactinopolyspora halotolerans TaxID=1981512 RepID=A0A6L9S270_9ACTN|nr:dihydrodipicolinate synthase family protein [Phytoactinopolyspora halotolerans]NED98880.1 N-acetylneuraminate lyase [Phytoactinopolyspora halotolerans]